jgi:hypothetical protein
MLLSKSARQSRSSARHPPRLLSLVGAEDASSFELRQAASTVGFDGLAAVSEIGDRIDCIHR